MKKIFLIISIISIGFSSFASNRVTPVSEAVKLIQDSVVNIRTEQIRKSASPFHDPFFDDFFGFSDSYRTQSLGSGVILSKDGLIVTNNHVVEAASKIFVILPDNRQLEAEVIGTDPTLDLAVIKIKGGVQNLTPARVGTSSDIMLGETVIAMGNPYGLNSSVTTGVVSNVRRVVGDGNGFSIFIQTDALINPGNSGGPLVNLDGEVIGINTAIYKEAQGIGFSIPIDIVRRAAPEFLKYGKVRRGYPGFSVREKKSSPGEYLEVTEIMRGGGAEKAGVRLGDKIISIDNIPVNTSMAFGYILRTFPAGQSVRSVFERNGERLNVNLVMSELPANFGLSILNARYGITFKEYQNHIVVAASKSDEYIRPGDALLAVNDVELRSSPHLAEILNDSDGKTVKLTFARGSRVFTVQLQM